MIGATRLLQLLHFSNSKQPGRTTLSAAESRYTVARHDFAISPRVPREFYQT